MTDPSDVARTLDAPAMRDLIGKLAAWPHGLGFLHLSDIESVAAVLNVDAYVITAARQALESPEGRAYLIAAVHEARVRATGRPAPEWGHPKGSRPAGPCVGCETDLIEAARAHPLGLAFLREGHPEAVAVVFGTHPDIVFRARQRLDRENKTP
jgi:hypothetical protein